MTPLKLNNETDVTTYAWRLYSDHLDSKFTFSDVTDPQKALDKGKYKDFLHKLPSKATHQPMSDNYLSLPNPQNHSPTVRELGIVFQGIERKQNRGLIRKMPQLDKAKMAMQFMTFKDKIQRNLDRVTMDTAINLPAKEKQKVLLTREAQRKAQKHTLAVKAFEEI